MARGPANSGADSTDLVLGGGSGEHPALVIHELGVLAAAFIWDQLPDGEEQSMPEPLSRALQAYRYTGDCLEFCGRSVNQYAELRRMARSRALCDFVRVGSAGTVPSPLGAPSTSSAWGSPSEDSRLPPAATMPNWLPCVETPHGRKMPSWR